MYCCNEFIFNTGFYGHVDLNTGDFHSLNDISDYDDDLTKYNFDKSVLWMRVADRFGSIHFFIIDFCPFCGAQV